MEVKAAPIATLFAALFAANAIDTIATHFALGLGVAEANPIVLAILDVFGIAGVAVVKLAFIMALGVVLLWDPVRVTNSSNRAARPSEPLFATPERWDLPPRKRGAFFAELGVAS
jgi:hypothetical protein